MCVQNLKFVALLIPEIIGGTPKIGQSQLKLKIKLDDIGVGKWRSF